MIVLHYSADAQRPVVYFLNENDQITRGLGEVVRRVLSEPSFAERAAALGRAIAEEGLGPARLVAEIGDFVLMSSQRSLSAVIGTR